MAEPEGAALHRASLSLLGSFCAELQREARKRLQADDVCAELTELQASSLRGVREGQRLAGVLQGLQVALQDAAGTCAGTQAALKERAEELELSMDEGDP